jgi:hypothetical protein
VITFLAGALTLGFLVAGLIFLRLWRKTSDRLFLAFAAAFALFALNQALAHWLGASDDRVAYTYLLRVLGYILILGAIVGKNVKPGVLPRRTARF